MKKNGIVAATLLAVSMLASQSAMASGPTRVCQAGGVRSTVLEFAMTRYFNWLLGSGQQEVGPLFMVPQPNGEQIADDPLTFQGSTSFTVRAGRMLVLPLSVYVGETYVGGVPAPDDPMDYLIDYKASSLLLTVDGRVIIDSTRTKLDCVYVDTFYFPKPIVYPEPTEYGSNAAIWMLGLATVLPPLPPGEHIINLQVVSPLSAVLGVDLAYYNTWYVSVVRPRKGH